MQRKMALIIIWFFALFSGSYAFAVPVIADMSLRAIEIDSRFKGTEILLFGARNDAGDVVVVIRGPEFSYVGRKKERIAGIWVNSKEAYINNALGFYDVATSRPLDEIKNDKLISSLGIGMDNLILNVDAKNDEERKEFKNAFLAKKKRDNVYMPLIGSVDFIGDTLFRTIIKFPENIPRGTYTAEVYLFSDGQLVGIQSTPILVEKIGFDAIVYDFAYKYPAFYGIIAVIIALAAGWAAGAIFRRI